MPSRHYTLAQVNVARMLAPIDSPQMAAFVEQLPAVNALADSSPGFVWRLATEAGDSTAVRAYEDAAILFNLSVWESAEALRQFTYSDRHLAVMRDRAKWFERPQAAQLAMWWQPRGHTPTVQEGVDRLAFRRLHGDTLAAFSMASLCPPPDEPECSLGACSVDLDAKVFVPTSNTPNGDAGGETRFHYRQSGDRVWATYDGGGIRFGCLVGGFDNQGRLDVRYHHADSRGSIRTGKSIATTQRLADGRVQLHEQWQWTNGDKSTGNSTVESVATVRP